MYGKQLNCKASSEDITCLVRWESPTALNLFRSETVNNGYFFTRNSCTLKASEQLNNHGG